MKNDMCEICKREPVEIYNDDGEGFCTDCHFEKESLKQWDSVEDGIENGDLMSSGDF